jgi:hypothetical protein
MSDFMNPPVPPDGQAYVSLNTKDGTRWVRCGWCDQKLFPVDRDTQIIHLRLKCKKCKRLTEIFV